MTTQKEKPSRAGEYLAAGILIFALGAVAASAAVVTPFELSL